MDLFTLASSMGLSAPLTLLGLAALHYAGAAPPFVERAIQRHPGLVSPVLLLLAVLLFAFELLATKSKLTKPFKAVWDLVQLVVKPVTVAMFGLALLDLRIPVEAPQASLLAMPGLATISLPTMSLPAWGWFEVALAISVTLLVHLVRAGSDLLVWLSPFPLIDALLSTLADLYTVVMIGLAFLFPRAAAVACTLQLAGCILVAGWMARVIFTALRLLGGRLGLASGHLRRPPAAIAARPGGEVASWCWTQAGGPAGRFATTWAWLDGGTLRLASRGWWRWREVAHPLGAGRHAAIEDGLLARDVWLRQGPQVVAQLRFPIDRGAEAYALGVAMGRAGTGLDDATGSGPRLPARARSQVAH
jgi:hypothetical protein